MKKPFILFFITGMVPTDENREAAKKLIELGAQVGFRNLTFVNEGKLSELKQECNGVAGKVPPNYAKRYDDAEKVIEEWRKANEEALKAAEATTHVDVEDPTNKVADKTLADYGYGEGEEVYVVSMAACSNHDVIDPLTQQAYGSDNFRSYSFVGSGERKNMFPEDALAEAERGNVTILDKSESVKDMETYLASPDGQAYLATPAGQTWATENANVYKFTNPGPAAPSGFTGG